MVAFSQHSQPHSHLVTSLSVARRRHISAVLLVRRLLSQSCFSGPWKGNKKSPAAVPRYCKAATVCVLLLDVEGRVSHEESLRPPEHCEEQLRIYCKSFLAEEAEEPFLLFFFYCKTYFFFSNNEGENFLLCRKMSSWNLDLEPLLRGCVTAFMSTRLPRTSATKLTSLLLDYLVGNLKPFIGGEDKIF